MDLNHYLETSRRIADAAKQKVRELGVFDFSYVPKQIFIRPEAPNLIDAMVKFDATGLPFNLYLFGSRGSGKTLLLKYLQDFLRGRLKTPIRYLNCRFSNTSAKVLAELTGRKARGLGTSELYEDFTRRYERLILVLDEVDLLSDRDRNKDLLYLLSRSEKRYMLVLLSNNPGFYNRIDLSARSSLQLERIFFRNYNASEILEILGMRCSEGGCEHQEGDLAKVAALTSRDGHGDVRIAMKALLYLLTGRAASVEACFEAARQDLYLDLVAHQSDAVLLILKAASMSSQKLVKPVYERYRQICGRFREVPYTYMHFYNHLSYLQSVGLLILVAARVHRGTSRSIEFLFDERVLEKVFRLRFGS